MYLQPWKFYTATLVTILNNRGGKRKGAGRKPGSKNRGFKVEDILVARNFDPLEALVCIAQGDAKSLSWKEEIPIKIRFDAMKELAQYCAPKLKASELTIEAGEQLKQAITVEFVKTVRQQ